MNGIFQDWRANRHDSKSQVVLVLFRLAQWLTRLPGPLRIFAWPYFAFYRAVVEWTLGIELRRTTQIGPRLILHHGQCLVVNDRTVIGADCTLRHGTTIGNKTPDGECPRIGNNVSVGAQCVILGGITIGDGASIGAGSVVVKDVAPASVVAGNPARAI